MADVKRLSSSDAGFEAELTSLTAIENSLDEAVDRTAAAILADVNARGDTALLEYTTRFDRVTVSRAADLEIARAELEEALAGLDAASRDSLRQAADRIRAYHERQRASSWDYAEADGTRLGQRITP